MVCKARRVCEARLRVSEERGGAVIVTIMSRLVDDTEATGVLRFTCALHVKRHTAVPSTPLVCRRPSRLFVRADVHMAAHFVRAVAAPNNVRVVCGVDVAPERLDRMEKVRLEDAWASR